MRRMSRTVAQYPPIHESGANKADKKLKEDGTPLETPVVSLDELTDSQRRLAVKMLTEEAESFAQNEDEIGCIEGLLMNLELSDKTPVQGLVSRKFQDFLGVF